jgi:hypothetical protein
MPPYISLQVCVYSCFLAEVGASFHQSYLNNIDMAYSQKPVPLEPGTILSLPPYDKLPHKTQARINSQLNTRETSSSIMAVLGNLVVVVASHGLEERGLFGGKHILWEVELARVNSSETTLWSLERKLTSR